MFSMKLHLWILAGIVSFSLGSATLDAQTSPAVGGMVTVVSTAQRNNLGLNSWPDGPLGVVSNGTSFIFEAANSAAIARMTGTLDNPLAFGGSPSLAIRNPKETVDYAAGGPVYQVPNSSTWLMVYHLERWHNGDSTNFWASLGLAQSTDQGQTWTDLGEIIQHNTPSGSAGIYDIGGGTLVVINGYLYIYFLDWTGDAPGTAVFLAVARAKVTDVVAAAAQGNVTPFFKFYNGAWTQPALGGVASELGAACTPKATGWFGSVVYNTYLQKYILVYPTPATGTNVNLYLASSSDGLSWTGSSVIANAATEQFYPTVLGEDGNPSSTGQQFYVYYTSSVSGGFNRWTDAVLARRLVSLSGTLDFSPAITAAATASSTTPQVGQSVNFSVAASDPNLSALSYTWTFGDGATTSGASVSHAYSTIGNFTATVTVSNVQGQSAVSTVPLSGIQGTGETFSQWEAAYSFTGAATATPNNDGVSNILKSLFDINPTANMSTTDRAALPHLGKVTTSGTTYLTLTYRENPRLTVTTVNVETSPDLKVWTIVANPTVTQVGTDSATGDPIIQTRVPFAGSTEFMRLVVTP